MPTTLLRQARWAVLWDAANNEHRYAEHIDLAWRDGTIVYAGPAYEAPLSPEDTVVDGRSCLVMPGLINLHAHPHTEPAYKGIREDHGRPEMYGTGLYERTAAFSLSFEGRAAGAELSYGELLLNGVTTLVDLSTPFDGWVDLCARSGLRVFLAPGFASARWYLDSLHEVKFSWDEAASRAAFDRAIEVMTAAERHGCGRLSGVVFPAQIDTCTEALFKDAIALAEESNRPITTHISQSMIEFLEMVKRHGISPVQWADQIGLLGPKTILAHAIFLDSHPATHWHTRLDLGLLADTGTAVAHCPSPFARYGYAMTDFGAYERAGVTMGIGTDVAPHNVLEEMRLAIVLARVVTSDLETTAYSRIRSGRAGHHRRFRRGRARGSRRAGTHGRYGRCRRPTRGRPIRDDERSPATGFPQPHHRRDRPAVTAQGLSVYDVHVRTAEAHRPVSGPSERPPVSSPQ